MSDSGGASGIQQELVQKRPFHSIRAEVAVSILRTAALIERHFAQVHKAPRLVGGKGQHQSDLHGVLMLAARVPAGGLPYGA